MISRFRVNKCCSFLKLFTSFFLSIGILLGSSSVVFADDGDLDPTFGDGGIVSTPFYNANSRVSEMVLQSDGKIVACGYSYHDENADIHLVRFNSDGTLDSSFGEAGMVMTDMDGLTNTCSGMAIQNDGKIVMVGETYDPVISDPVITMLRYNSDGSLDSSFGTDGIIRQDFTEDMISAFSLVLSGDKIIIGLEIFGGSAEIVLIQYNHDGSIDTGFGVDGIVSPTISNLVQLSAMSVQGDGKLLVSGSVQNGFQDDIGLIRLDTDGTLDTSFGINGIATADNGGVDDSGQALAVQGDGKIVVAGNSSNGLNRDFAVVRFSSSGLLETGFGAGGFALVDFSANSDSAFGVAIQSDDKIVVTGYTDDGAQNDMAVARLDSNGLLDESFGVEGKASYAFASGFGRSFNIVLQGSDILIGGSWSDHSQWDVEGKSQGVVIRFSDQGALDMSFGVDGIVIFHGIADVQINDVLIQSDNKILVAGQTSGYLFDDIFLARYESNGSPDPTFGEDGFVVTSFSARDDQALALALQSDGKILIGGTAYDEDFSMYKMAVVRYAADGSLDSTFGNGGITTYDYGGAFISAMDIGQLSDGKIIVVGQSRYGMEGIILARFNQNGSLDKSQMINDLDPEYTSGEAMVIDEVDNLILVGYSNDGGDDDIILARLTSELELDPSFGSSGTGMVFTDLNGGDDRGEAILMQGGMRLIVAGYTENGGGSDFALVGYSLSGVLDTSFGTNGYVVTSVGSGDAQAWDMAFSSDGRIVVAGQSSNGDNDEFAIVRYYPNGTLDPSFGVNGILTMTVGNGSVGKAVAVQEDNNLVVAGFASDGLHNNIALVRYTQVDYQFASYIPIMER